MDFLYTYISFRVQPSKMWCLIEMILPGELFAAYIHKYMAYSIHHKKEYALAITML